MKLSLFILLYLFTAFTTLVPTIVSAQTMSGVAIGSAAGGGSGSIVAALTASRTSGAAPLIVHFHTEGTTNGCSLDSFGELRYSWDFNDPGAGNWAVNGRSKGTDQGVVAAHVFESPGTYNVLLTVTGSNCSTDTESVQITVTDANTQWAGFDTVCIGNILPVQGVGGCPSGSDVLASSDFDAALQSGSCLGTNDRRCLFKRGDTFTSDAVRSITADGPNYIGAYGTGAKPIITDGGAHPGTQDGYIRFSGATDVRVADLNFQITTPTVNAFAMLSTSYTSHVLILRAESTGGEFAVMSTNPSIRSAYIGIVESKCNEPTGGNAYCLYLESDKAAVLGNELSQTDSDVQSHVFRGIFYKHGVFAHNLFDDCTGNNHCMKIYADAHTTADTEWFQLHANNITTNTIDPAGWALALGPQNDTSDEWVHDGIIEDNYIKGGNGIGIYASTTGRVWVRNNAIDMTGFGGTGPKCIQFIRRGILSSPNPVHQHADNNTCFNDDNGDTTVMIDMNWGAAPETCNNNLWIGDGTLTAVCINSVTALTNLFSSLTSIFETHPPTARAHFKIISGTAPEDAGTCISSVTHDFEGNVRPVNSICDVGVDEDP